MLMERCMHLTVPVRLHLVRWLDEEGHVTGRYSFGVCDIDNCPVELRPDVDIWTHVGSHFEKFARSYDRIDPQQERSGCEDSEA